MTIISNLTRISSRPPNYEILQASNQVWWSNQFKELEAGIKVPPYRLLSELIKIFNEEELIALKKAGLEYKDDLSGRKLSRKEPYFKVKRRPFRSMVYTRVHRRCNVNYKKHKFTDRMMDFFQKPRGDFGCWRPKKRWISLSLLPCIFEPSIYEKMLSDNLEMISLLPIREAVYVNILELAVVPDAVADYVGLPSQGESCSLHRELKRDQIVANKAPISHAFGTMLPVQLRKSKNTSTLSHRWFKIECQQEDLKTFAAVFKGILELETSKGFIEWLRKHRKVQLPEFLRQNYNMKPSKKLLMLCKKCNTGPFYFKCETTYQHQKRNMRVG